VRDVIRTGRSRPVIIWINGPFGAGKTTLSGILARRVPDALVVDPEVLGYAFGRLVPAGPTGDFQDLPIWRSLTRYTLGEVRRLYRVPVIVPMTLVVPGYVEQIIGGLAAAGEWVLHVFLDADAEVVRARIRDQAVLDGTVQDDEVRRWRLAQVNRCLAARATMPAGTLMLDCGRLPPDELADEVIAHLPAPPGD